MQDTSQEKTKKSNLRKKQANAYMKYSGMAFQMGVTIAIFSFIGQRLDSYFETSSPFWTAGFALFGVRVALYFLLKDVLNSK